MRTKPVLNLHRSLETVEARRNAPEAPGHAGDEQIDAILIATMVSSIKALQRIAVKQGEEIAELRQKIKEHGYMVAS